MIVVKKILVATDFGEASETALNYGRALATLWDATLHVLHVTENTFLTAASAYGYPSVSPLLQEEIEATARKQTTALLTAEDRDALHAIAVTMTDQSPAAAIVEYAKANGIDLIVLGSHGRGALAHLVMGSVAERVVRTAPCAVLTVRNPEHEFVLPDALVAVSRA